MAASSPIEAHTRLARLRAHLQSDPDNRLLLADMADAAFAAGDLDTAETCLERLRNDGALAAGEINLAGLIAIVRGRYDAAVALLAPLVADRQEPGTCFNLAWALALLGRHAEVIPLLPAEVIAAVPHAAALKVQALHHLGRLDEALSLGTASLEERADDAALAGAVAILALDADDPVLAERCAALAPDGVPGRIVRGMLALARHETTVAARHFDAALAREDGSGRAWLGRGLALLEQGHADEALPAILRAAELMRNHPGSWLAVGWLRFIAGDHPGARAAFDRVATIDPAFGEAHGALAVLDLLAGDAASARARLAVAERLDRDALGVRLATYLLRHAAGDTPGAEAIYQRALHAGIGPDGATIAGALAALATRRR